MGNRHTICQEQAFSRRRNLRLLPILKKILPSILNSGLDRKPDTDAPQSISMLAA